MSPSFRLVLGNEENIVSSESETRTPFSTVASSDVRSGIRVSSSRKMVLAHSSVVDGSDEDCCGWGWCGWWSVTGEESGEEELDEIVEPFRDDASCGNRPTGNVGLWYWCRRCLSPSL